MDSINHMFDGGVEDEDVLAPTTGVGLPGPLSNAGTSALGDDGLNAGGIAPPSSSFGAADGFGAASAGTAPAGSSGAAAAGGAGAAPVAAGAPPAVSTAPAPVFRPVLRGKLFEVPTSGGGFGSGVTYAWEGRWAMSETDSVWGDFRYTMRVSGQQAVPLPPAHVMPLNPRLPSAVEHPPVGGPMAGQFMMLGADGKSWTGIKDKVTFKIGGPLPAEAPQSVTTLDGVTVGGGSLVGITGEGALQNAVRYELRGSYHPASGTAWVVKVMASAPGTPKPRPPPGERKRAAPAPGGAGGAPKAVRSLEDGLSASAASLPASRGASLRGVAGGSGSKAFLRECEMLLTALRRDRVNSPYFMEPVDPVKHCCPDYFDKVAQPMDLSTVATKLKDVSCACHSIMWHWCMLSLCVSIDALVLCGSSTQLQQQSGCWSSELCEYQNLRPPASAAALLLVCRRCLTRHDRLQHLLSCRGRPISLAVQSHLPLARQLTLYVSPASCALFLVQGAYGADRAAFAADVRLVFDNAMTYNPPAHPVHIAAGE